MRNNNYSVVRNLNFEQVNKIQEFELIFDPTL